MGTVFAASKESVIHENYKNSILKAKDIDSRVTGRSTGHPIRVLRNDMARKYLELEKSGAPFEELEQLTLGRPRLLEWAQIFMKKALYQKLYSIRHPKWFRWI